MKQFLLFYIHCLFLVLPAHAQDTFSIVAVDTITGEVGSAGASCVDMFNFPGYETGFIGELFPGVGAINTQAAYNGVNQVNARDRMDAGDSPDQIIDWLVANDVDGTPGKRQYGIVRLTAGSSSSAGYTGADCFDYKNHIEGPNYCIQGNILLGQQILDSMEVRFNREPGDLACKLMAALQGANVIGADTRCASDGTSSLHAFIKVSKPDDIFGNPSLLLSVKTHDNTGIEPIDSLQKLFNSTNICSQTGIVDAYSNENKIFVYPNPSSNLLSIEIPKHITEVSIKLFTSTGQFVMKTSETNFSVAGLPVGLYFIQIQIKNTTYHRTFIKVESDH